MTHTLPAIDPYRILFPLGIFYALAAALVWPLYALGWIGYPAILHWTLMVQGFLHCFIFGFLLTALPSFLHADKTRPWETFTVFGCMVLFGVFSLAGLPTVAQIAFLATFGVLVQAAVRRLARRRGDPPEEFVFVALGMAMGIVGGFLSLLSGAGLWSEPAPRFALHVLSRGMALSIVIGLGGLLVPTFSAMREPLVIPGIARPGQRAPRRLLYAPLCVALVAALVLESYGHVIVAAWLRAAVATLLGFLVWKLFRLPGRRTLLSWTIWGAGWLLVLGTVLAAILPDRAVLAFHLVFLGGFGLLILGIATRVIVTHGGYPSTDEGRVLHPVSIVAVALALAVRVSADFAGPLAPRLYGMSGLFWITGWLIWAWRALPRMVRRRGAPIIAADHPQRILLEKAATPR